MEIRKYRKEDEDALFDLMKREGEEWADYWEKEDGRLKYIEALRLATTTYVVIEDGLLCGFARAIGSFTIYVDDLLVDKQYRGRSFGKLLMDAILDEFPDKGVYVMSDVDEYYAKLGYEKAGTIFAVRA